MLPTPGTDGPEPGARAVNPCRRLDRDPGCGTRGQARHRGTELASILVARHGSCCGEDRPSDAKFGAKPSLCGEKAPNFLPVTRAEGALPEPAPGPELPPGPPTPPDMELVMKTAAEYGLDILGPPGIPA